MQETQYGVAGAKGNDWDLGKEEPGGEGRASLKDTVCPAKELGLKIFHRGESAKDFK